MTGQNREQFLTFAIGAAVLAGLYLTKLYNYLLFHAIVEMFSVVVAFGIFVIAWNARRFMNNSYFLFVGIAFFFTGTIDFLHALAYKGMGIFPGHDANLPTQLWIVARYLHAFSLLAAPYFLTRKLKPRLAAAAYLIVTAILLSAVFNGYFPDCFITGIGLTPFKKGSEYLICAMFLGSLILMRRRADAFDRDVVRLLSAAIGIQIASELSFTLYNDVYGIANMVGHALKFAGFWLVYKAIIGTGLERPYSLLFRELKQSHEEIETLNADLALRADKLEAALCELEIINQELATTNQDLEAANLELEAFNYTVSHDLRTPLTCVKGFSQLLLETDAERLGKLEIDPVLQIYAAAGRMDQLITTLLDFSRLTRKEISRETVDLGRLASGIIAGLKVMEPERRVTIRIAENEEVSGDPRLLEVMLQNLLGNAWKYSSTRPEAIIEFGVQQQDGNKVYFVRDNGVGFDMAAADRLFAVFKRLHTAEEFEGIGIGLATVQRIVQRHKGEVWAEGELEKGATFYFTLGK